MQYQVSTPEEYLEVLEEDWRKVKLLEVRALILSFSPKLEEFIHYKMLAYGGQEEYVFHLNAQKHYVGLYVGDIQKIDSSGSLLAEFDCGKGCIRIKRKDKVNAQNLGTFIEQALSLWREGKDLSC
ncbi:DUF1801 domain-containing protein [Persicobacter diffluens]|uniref:YdhG-like domain-containing protein n=1 Tax=Persicobacter diffluens TaxID=981 RepID=A0AAN4VV52_9BACT|nr:hypothetical protein PEDI_12560 [Persicobacter diffluens]